MTPRQRLMAAEMHFDGPSHVFARAVDNSYTLTCGEYDVEFSVDRLWWEKEHLKGELRVYCGLAGAYTVDGLLSYGVFNFSDTNARYHLQRTLTAASRTGESVNWRLLLEELCIRIAEAEREGQPAQELTTYPLPAPEDVLDLDGLVLPKAHPSILFGDGGTGKSVLALWLAGRLAERGIVPLYCDWELSGSDHRARLERLFGTTPPVVPYLRCDRPLVVEADRIRRQVVEYSAGFVICDSVAFASSGPPEAADVAAGYFRGVRQFGEGVGSLHLAHVVKAREFDDKQLRGLRPFGSAFWHNGARATWFIKRADDLAEDQRLVVGCFHQKANLGPLLPAVGFEMVFRGGIRVRRVEVGDIAELAAGLSVSSRVRRALKHGALTVAAIAEEAGAPVDTVQRTVLRGSKSTPPQYVRLTHADGIHRWALAAAVGA